MINRTADKMHQRRPVRLKPVVRHVAGYNRETLQEAARYLGRKAVEMKLLEDTATHDTLTRLLNERGFSKAVSRELQRCERGLATGGLIAVFDLDNYQAVYRVHGARATEACLKLLAHTIESEVRAMDVAARTGPGEIVLLLSNTTKKKAASRLQLLMWRLNRLELAWQGQYVPVRVSLSLQEYERGKVDNVTQDWCGDHQVARINLTQAVAASPGKAPWEELMPAE